MSRRAETRSARLRSLPHRVEFGIGPGTVHRFSWKSRLFSSLANLHHEIIGTRLLQHVLSPFDATDLVTIIHCEQGIDDALDAKGEVLT